MAKYIYSTLTADNKYASYSVAGDGTMLATEKEVLIKGGSNVAGKNLVTPYGVATKVEDRDFELLVNNPVFKLHMDNGFIKVSDHQEDAEVVAADLVGRDESSPLVEQDFEEEKAPVSNKKRK